MAEAKTASLLEQTVVDLINKSVSSIEKGAEFLAGQLPDIAEQFLKWRLTANAVEACVFIILLLIIWFPIRYWFKKQGEQLKLEIKGRNESSRYANEKYDPMDVWFPFIVVSVLTTIFFGIAVLLDIMQVIKIYIAPKVYLIEWAKDFI